MPDKKETWSPGRDADEDEEDIDETVKSGFTYANLMTDR
jgi:ATP-dependent DNA helicase 2 subunit 1